MGDVPGLSKCGSFYFNSNSATTQNIDCGFGSSTARFVLLKNVDQITNNWNNYGIWYWWDNARGIVAGNDPTLAVNNPNYTEQSLDFVDPYNGGFTINYVNATYGIATGWYIYWAIA